MHNTLYYVLRAIFLIWVIYYEIRKKYCNFMINSFDNIIYILYEL